MFWCETLLIDGAPTPRVRLELGANGRIARVTPGSAPQPGDVRLGTVLPGMANAHSHAFHRALRGRTHADGGDFWQWRNAMYEVAGRLDPALYFALARAVFAEMLVSGFTVVGEFHYLHHRPDGSRYPREHAMELALADAARAVGIRLVLLDTLYLAGGIGAPLEPAQRRFGDGSASAWLTSWQSLAETLGTAKTADSESDADAHSDAGMERGSADAEHAESAVYAGGSMPGADDTTNTGDTGDTGDTEGGAETSHRTDADLLVTLGAAIHSVRAVPSDAIREVLAGLPTTVPLHIHLSEQPQENTDCLAAYGRTPTGLLHDLGALTLRLSVVHATHLTDEDLELLGATSTTVVICPTTEADLGDGIGPARRLADAGARIALGSDQNAVIDPLLELRGLEAGERLASGQRGRFDPAELLAAATTNGYAALGLGEQRLRPGDLCDLVEVSTDSVRTVGSAAAQLPLTATAADVLRVIVHGVIVADSGRLVSGADRRGPEGVLARSGFDLRPEVLLRDALAALEPAALDLASENPVLLDPASNTPAALTAKPSRGSPA